jgi:exonuclease SbcC
LSRFKKLVIENFQSHQYTEIEFSEGLNVFVGPSDSGKSAILRALRWVLFNVPRGTEFIRTGAKECRVSLTFEDGTEVVRIRSASVNRYVLRTPEGKEQVFEGFGNTVPQEIADVHQIKPIKLDQKEMLVHFGTQLESPFLLFESNQNKAKTIGRISGAHLIDNALKKTSGDRHALSGEIKQLEQEQQRIKEKLKPYENLEELEQAYNMAEAAFRSAKEKKDLADRLSKHLEALSMIRVTKRKTEEMIAALSQLPQGEEIIQRLERKMALGRQFVRLNEKWRRVQKDKEESVKIIGAAVHLPLAQAALDGLGAKKEKLIKLLRLRDKWNETKREKEQQEHLRLRLGRVPETDHLVRGLEQKVARLNVLKQLEKKLETLSRELGRSRRLAGNNHQLVQCLQEVLPGLEEKAERLHKLRQLHEKWADVTQRITRGQAFLADRQKEMDRLINEWAKLLTRLGKCPTCNSRIDASVIEHIMEEYRGGFSHAAAGRED